MQEWQLPLISVYELSLLRSCGPCEDRFTSRYRGITVDQRWRSSAHLPNCKQKKPIDFSDVRHWGLLVFKFGEVSDGSVQSQFSPPTTPRWQLSTWVRWAFGSVVTLILPFWGKQWRAVSRIECEAEVAAHVVEEAADVVEKISVMAEKASEEVFEKLPEHSKLRSTVMLVESMSKEAAAEAHLVKDIIHKVEDLKEEVENLLNPTKIPQKLMDKDKHY